MIVLSFVLNLSKIFDHKSKLIVMILINILINIFSLF